MSKSAQDRKLSPAKRRAIAHLIGEPCIERACERSGISRPTYYHWCQTDPDFVAELEEARNAVLEEAMEKLRLSVNQATDELIKLLGSQNEEIRRKAANDILSFVMRWKEQADIESRLTEIETVILERRRYS